MWPHSIPKHNNFNKLKSTLSEVAFTQVSAFLANLFLRRFKRFFSLYTYVVIQPPMWPYPPLGFIIIILNHLYPRMLPHNYQLFWPIGHWEIFFLKDTNTVLISLNYLPLKEGVVRYYNKRESSPPKDALSQVWLKSAQ